MRSRKKAMKRDRISALPQPILHHILSHLSQNDAVKTCVLSKPWRHLWYGRPNVEFCKDDLFKGTVENFISVLDQTLIRYDNQNLSIQKFILKMPETTIDSVFALFLEKWIPKIIMRNFKGLETFHLSFHPSFRLEGCKLNLSFHSVYFDLPSEIFLSESLREIHLDGCKLNRINSSTEKVLSRHLQTLRLHYVKVEEGTFERIMSSCPLIQEVSLIECEGLKTIKVNNHNCNLKNFEFWGYEDPLIEIANVSHIETIKITCYGDWFEHYHNNLFTRLKSLHLSYVDLTQKSVHSFSCNFPCLEELELFDCLNSEEFHLSSRSIKRLVIDEYDPIKVSIDAPNLFEFGFEGYDFPSHISFTTTSNKWKKSKICLRTDLDDPNDIDLSKWLHKLDELLNILSRSETSVHIVVYRSEDHWRVDGDPFCEIKVVRKHLELCLGSQLCSNYSVLYEVNERTIKKWNSS